MTQTKQPTKAQRMREMMAEGRTAAEIAATLGITVQRVYAFKSQDKRRQATRISPKTGKPVRKYTKREGVKAEVRAKPKKAQALIVIPKEEFLRMQEENKALRNRPPVTVEVPVPQPFSHYTFWQRLRILFLGGAA